jgi:TPR repeat protein
MVFFALALCAGCDAGTGFGPFAGGRADIARAGELFTRVQQNDWSALAELEERAKKNDLAAAFYAGLALDLGLGGAGDMDGAAGLYESAGRAFAGAKHNQALLALKGAGQAGADPALALKLLTEAASKQRLESMLMLASLYERGWPGIDRNPALAAEWYERAVTLANDPWAQVRLGAAYQDGAGRHRDMARTQTYLLAAAKAGVSEAQYRMALTLDDPVQIAQWLAVAALGDSAYEPIAIEAMSRLSRPEQIRVKRNAELWRHAHDRGLQLVPFASPVRQP